jgi:hypothetical protein
MPNGMDLGAASRLAAGSFENQTALYADWVGVTVGGRSV